MVLPGQSYSAEAPLTFYIKLAFLKHGWDWLSVDYRYSENAAFLHLTRDAQARYLEDEAALIAQYVVEHYAGRHLVVVAKSLGTSILCHMLRDSSLLETFRPLGQVLLTPATLFADLVQIAERSSDPVFTAIGTDDPFYDQSLLSRLQARAHTRTVVVDDAGHIFEDAGQDLQRSIENLATVVASVEKSITDGFYGL